MTRIAENSVTPYTGIFKRILFTAALSLVVFTGMAQRVVRHYYHAQPIVAKSISLKLANFYHLTNEAGMLFTFPDEFKELPVSTNKNFPFNYAMELPDHGFELWFRVRSAKEDLSDLAKYRSNHGKKIVHPDSAYIQTAYNQITAFCGDQSYFTTNIPQDILARYNATAGKTYLLNLLDMEETKHYKYALLIALHKSHGGTIIVACLSDDKGPEFFKNVSKASKCLKFKP